MLGWALLVLGVLGLVLPFLQGFLFLALGVYVLRDQHIWAADRWAWVARKWPGAVGAVEGLDAKVTERVAGWGAGMMAPLILTCSPSLRGIRWPSGMSSVPSGRRVLPLAKGMS